MAQIEGIRIQNYRALKDVTLGKTVDQYYQPLGKLATIIGPNGCGKSTLMDAFAFISDCLTQGVEESCERQHRGGFHRLHTRGQDGSIQFEIYYREDAKARPISYSLHIDLDPTRRPYVRYERLRQRRKGQKWGQPFSFLELSNGTGVVWAGESTGEEDSLRKNVSLDDPRKLGITTLGNLSDHPRIVAFRQFLEGWYLSYFVPDAARGLPMAGAQKHLNREGSNLANYVQFMERKEPKRFQAVLDRIAKKIPGVQKIATKIADDGRLLIQFDDRGYKDPFFAQDMSDGTLKMFAYLLLLEDPEPFPLIGIEEPENGLHHKLLEPLALEMKRYSQQGKASQIVVTTHSPHFVDALKPEDVWILEKDANGFTTASRASDAKEAQELHKEGIPLGSLWYSNHLGKGNP
ncbi:MAG: AAA family ATPase [Ignavibacteriales bacterium]|nr:AAA family ATPase [Ignavibacteriales bacterium]